jgi:hypothetical protein
VSPPRPSRSRRRRTVQPNRAFLPWPPPPELRRAPGSLWPGRLRPVLPPLSRASCPPWAAGTQALMVWPVRAPACRRAAAQLRRPSPCLATTASHHNHSNQVALWVRFVGGKPLGVLASPETSPAARSRRSKPAPASVRMAGGVRSTGQARMAADLGIPARVHLAF